MKQIIYLLVILLCIQSTFRKKRHHNRKHRSGSGDQTIFDSHLIIKQHSQNKLCRLQMSIYYKPAYQASSESVDPLSQVKVDMNDKSCYCQYIEELPQQNECESLLQEKQVQVSLTAYKEQLIRDTNVEDKRCVHSCYKEDKDKKKHKKRRLKHKKNINSQANPNHSILDNYGYKVHDSLPSYVVNGMPVWWISFNRYKLERCSSQQEYQQKCLQHCSTLETQTLDLHENRRTNQHRFTPEEASGPLDC